MSVQILIEQIHNSFYDFHPIKYTYYQYKCCKQTQIKSVPNRKIVPLGLYKSLIRDTHTVGVLYKICCYGMNFSDVNFAI